MAHRSYSDEFRAHVLDVYRAVGLNEAARREGIDKKSILRWAEAAGIDRHAVTAEVSEKHRRAGAAANARIAKERAEARERVLNRVIRVSEAAAMRELELLARGDFQREDLQAVTNARQKAIQQFELLEGRATSRGDNLGDVDTLVAGMAAAFQDVIQGLLERAGAEVADWASATFATALHTVRERSLAALEAGDAEDPGLDGEIVVEAEEPA